MIEEQRDENLDQEGLKDQGGEDLGSVLKAKIEDAVKDLLGDDAEARIYGPFDAAPVHKFNRNDEVSKVEFLSRLEQEGFALSPEGMEALDYTPDGLRCEEYCQSTMPWRMVLDQEGYPENGGETMGEVVAGMLGKLRAKIERRREIHQAGLDSLEEGELLAAQCKWQNPKALFSMAEKLHNALEDEAEAVGVLGDVQREADLLSAEMLEVGYGNGSLNGKNAEERARQETLYMSRHPEYQDLLRQIARQTIKRDEAKNKRVVLENTIGMIKAYLYSLGGRL